MSAPFRFPSLIALVCVAVLGCKKSDSGGAVDASAQPIKVDGSSTVYALTNAMIVEFTKETKGKIKVTGASSGTGGGFKKFCNGEIEIAGASRPITAEEMALCQKAGIEYIELPICFDALTVAVHKDATWVDSIKTSELKKIWEPAGQETVKLWSDIRPEWPKEKFALFGAGKDSGTYEYFTEAVVEQKKASRSDYTASENDNTIVLGIAGDKNALGFLPYSYYVESQDKIKAVAVDWDKDADGPVLPSVESVVAAKYNPLSRPLFIYVNKKAAARPEVKQFVDYYLANAKKLAQKVHFIPLPDKAYEMSVARFGKLQAGTGFGGKVEIGMPLEDVLKHEPKS
jgi:phosphate transport system substrate-binding protein